MEMPPPDEQLEFLRLVKKGAGQLTAAFAVNWTPAKLKHVMADPSFRDAYQQTVTMQVESIEKVVYRLAKRGMEMPPPDEQLEFLKLVKKGAGQLTAAYAVNWTPAKLKHVMADPSFREALQQTLTMQTESIEKVVYRLARRGNVRMIELYLYNRSPERWSPPTQRVKIDSTKRVEVAVVGSAVEVAKQLIAEPGAIAALQAGVIEAEARDDDGT